MKFRLEITGDPEEEILARVHERSELTDALERLVRQASGNTKISVYSEARDMQLELDYERIECIYVEDGKTRVVDEKGEVYLSRLRLYVLEEQLPECFIRINKSALANRRRIARFEAAFSGAVDVVFQSGYRDYVSRRCFSEIRRNMK